MLENIRKYSALMIIVVALLAFGLIVTLRDGNASGGAKKDLVSIEGNGFSQREIDLFTKDPGQVAGLSGTYSQGAQLLFGVSADYARISFPGLKDSQDPFRLAITHLLINQEAKKLGIFVTTADAEKFIVDEWFVDDEGQHDPSRYSEFVEKGLKNINMTEKSLKEYIVSLLTFAKVKEIKSIQGVPYSLHEDKSNERQQTADVEVIQFSNTNFKVTDEPTEEEISAFYEKNKNSAQYGEKYFRTAPKVKLTYIPINLEILVKAKEDDPLSEGMAMSSEITQKGLIKSYNKFLNDENLVGDKPDIESLTKKYDLDYKTTELLEAKDLPFKNFALRGEFEKRLPNGSMFSIHEYIVSPGILNCKRLEVSVPGAYRDRGFIHYRIDAKEPSRLKTLEESKKDIIELIKKEQQAEAAQKAAEEAIETVKKGLAEGKTIEESLNGMEATVAKGTDIHGNSSIPDSDFNGFTVYTAVQRLAPGSFSEVISNLEVTGFAYLKRRVIRKSQTELDNAAAQSTSLPEVIGFYEWLVQEYKETKEKDLINFLEE